MDNTNNSNGRLIKQTRFGLAEDPRGQHVAMMIRDRQYLGEVIALKPDTAKGVCFLEVRHFNGEMWPFAPVASAVRIIS